MVVLGPSWVAMVLGLLVLLPLALRPCMAFVPCAQEGDFQPEVEFVMPSLTDDGLAMTCGELVAEFTLNEGLTNSSTCVETLLGGSTVKALTYEMVVKYGCCGLGGCSKCGGETDDGDPDTGCQVEPGYFDHAHRTNQIHSPLQLSPYSIDEDIDIFIDPPGGFSHKALGIFIRAFRIFNGEVQYGTIYYEVSNVYNDIAQEYGMPAEPSLESPTLLWDKPYVHVYSGFDNQVNKTLTFIAVFENNEGVLPSRSYRQAYDFGVEGGDRTDSFAFLVPGIESKGNFIRVTLEVAAAARAQSAGSQEFANFYSPLGVGTYPEQVQKISLPDLYFELDGFEGGFSSEVDGTHYGVLIPHHNGMRFHGLVVRVNLMRMIDEVWCTNRTRFERWDRDLGQAVTVSHDGRDYDEPVESACITILDLESLHPRAFGFRRGFTADGFGFLAPGAKDIAVRLDLTTRDGFTLANTRIVPMGDVDSAFAGFSGGFPDGFAADNTLWACFNPMRTVYGPVGGYQSQDPADKFLLQPIHSAIIACLDFNIWDMWDATAGNAGELRAGFNMSDIKESIQWMDAGNLLPELRGFSDAVRAGRYAYLAPLASGVHEYSPQLVRIYCGNGKDEFIGDKIRNIRSSGGKLRSMMDVLDLSKANENLQGFSGIFTSGKFVILVPYRNKYEPENGQRGHSFVTRLDMNNFDLAGIDFIDVASTQRAQIPTIADKDLRGFCCGFPTGKYAVLIPFYNAVFSGKMARLQIVGDDMSSDLQELDLVVDAANPDLYKGYRGGFVSMWPGFKDSEG